ncbi:MAG TPA: tetratricopeptide repeat protein, partial [Myxococcaceae bacterium]
MPTDARLAEAQQAFEDGQRLKESGRSGEALPLAERALELREAVYGRTHPEVAACLELLGSVLTLQGEHSRAETLLHRSLAIREETLGKRHIAVAALL